MNPEELKKAVDDIVSQAGDDERAHSAEDDLHLEIIEKFCPSWVVAEIKRLTDADFARWYA